MKHKEEHSMNVLQQALLFVAILFSIIFFGSAIYYLAPVLTPFAIAAFLAYLADPLVERLSQGKFKIPRTIAVIGVFVIVIILLLICILLLVPALQKQMIVFSAKLPLMIDWIQSQLLPQLVAFGIAPEAFSFDTIKATFQGHISQASEFAKWMGERLFHSSLALLGWLMNLLIVFVASFYLLRDWQEILKKIKALLPKKYSKTVLSLAKQCDIVLATFVRGQLSMMASLSIYYGVGLGLMGVNFSLLLGLIAGFLSIVPYLGSIVGLGAAFIVAYVQFHTLWSVVGVLVLFGIGHILEGMILTPLLIGDKLGLHPVAVIFAVLAGAHLLGFVGVVLALPLTAILVVFFRELLNNFQTESP